VPGRRDLATRRVHALEHASARRAPIPGSRASRTEGRSMTPPRLLAALALAALALAGSSPGEGSRDASAAGPCASPASPAYTRRVDTALRANRDVWGETLLRSRHGPTYAGARRYLAPLILASAARGTRLTESGVYYLPFGEPIGSGGAST